MRACLCAHVRAPALWQGVLRPGSWTHATLPQTPTPESFLTTIRDEPEVPVSGGPSGDFELPEEETTQPDTANEVVAVGGAAAKPSPPPGTLPKGARPDPGLLDNAIDSGSSAAQLPQKSILERKEVLVGESWAQEEPRVGRLVGPQCVLEEPRRVVRV